MARRQQEATRIVRDLRDGASGESARSAMERRAAGGGSDAADAPRRDDGLPSAFRLHFLVATQPWKLIAPCDARRAAAHAIEAMPNESRCVRGSSTTRTSAPSKERIRWRVQRQYTGTTGKISNCQIGVQLEQVSDAFRSHVPIVLVRALIFARELDERAELASPALRVQDPPTPGGLQDETNFDLATRYDRTRSGGQGRPGISCCADQLLWSFVRLSRYRCACSKLRATRWGSRRKRTSDRGCWMGGNVVFGRRQGRPSDCE